MKPLENKKYLRFSNKNVFVVDQESLATLFDGLPIIEKSNPVSGSVEYFYNDEKLTAIKYKELLQKYNIL